LSDSEEEEELDSCFTSRTSCSNGFFSISFVSSSNSELEEAIPGSFLNIPVIFSMTPSLVIGSSLRVALIIIVFFSSPASFSLKSGDSVDLCGVMSVS